MDSQSKDANNQNIVDNNQLNIWEALIPVFALVGMLFYNVLFAFGDDALSGSNQFILLLGAAVAAIVGYFNKVGYETMVEEVAQNIKSTTGALLILLMVGSLAGTWMISGIIPTMIYYGMQILNPTIFLAACVIICAIISIATGSSWTTSATVGIALIGIAEALGISLGMTAGAVLSGAYFGDKLSPLSDTTNLAPAMAGTDLFTHIRYMTLTTVPTIIVTLIVFIIIGLNLETTGTTDTEGILTSIDAAFNISPWLFAVPIIVIALIIKKTSPLIALLLGTLLGGAAALIFQPEIVTAVGGGDSLTFETAYKGVMNAITVDTAVATDNEALNELFSAGGMSGMLGTIWLIICAMVFGGVMDAIGALATISKALLKLFHTTFGLFASTVASCLAINVTASDQYLAIVVPGKMYSKAFADKGLAPENLSRTLEDSGTVTSVLIPWNTCGAYQSGVLGVSVADYFVYAIFNWLSPFMTLLFAAFNIKIRQLTGKDKTGKKTVSI
ncbi:MULTISPECIES: Na+/H+ antiporter NhaC [Croceibacter]|jgi:NhaC family Na+:H+ antiporter|uniref:Na+/H+ antiporter n=1 Tax=Croceibacter atlanticus (strain ATCC BAA-628 / JCM 21780 / CIP 108009 / IAM 15332 / KCTC 12090 / HTCC2559) TaxID=216432 RepID=A3UAN2_CROAH|nr:MULTISPECIES: Na+/H+ antiporter NhaC [Croceibacter]HAT70582.1 Na+/H+ antiporter NhaC [Flavobacteriaceae bacterium]EAP86868.1 Na+/H+ antiporter [Croceibacter atlanticus HTCC2559]MBG24965.1 Na+/H+ antiporter NhaC [Croceibacter sp.]MBW4970632.1 Na+/H+ antiporter NhaC [Croceibacter atlanticus]WSP34433.1 Na+/H+ antiporter NhaC [Croceibacter atlanticus]|tara:strand:- start:149741 stop:151246 length:1506 start_codon:yes stop_codon:yes gene_type:complete